MSYAFLYLKKNKYLHCKKYPSLFLVKLWYLHWARWICEITMMDAKIRILYVNFWSSWLMESCRCTVVQIPELSRHAQFFYSVRFIIRTTTLGKCFNNILEDPNILECFFYFKVKPLFYYMYIYISVCFLLLS